MTKSDFFRTPYHHLQKNNFDREITRSEDLGCSHLILFDEKGSIYQFFDITMPYLIIYESVNIGMDKATYQEFSENSRILINTPYTEFINQTRKLHSHNFYELLFVLSGQVTMQIEEERITYVQGECCLCNKNIHHLEMMEEEAEILLFLVKEDYVKEVCDTNYYYDQKGQPHAVGTVFNSFFTENRKNPLYDAKIYADYKIKNQKSLEPLLKIINTMVAEISGTHSGKSHMMKALLCRFLEMMEDDTVYHEEIHWARLSNEEQIIFRITEAYRKKDGIFTRADIERITGYNGDYVERIMKKHTGKTLSAHGRDFLVQKAAELLKHTDKSIAEICETLGYSNRSYFNRIFAARYGLTPSEFRKQCHRTGGSNFP